MHQSRTFEFLLRHHGKHEHQHTHAANPVRQRAPKRDPAVKILGKNAQHLACDRRARGRKSRYRFKKRIDRIGQIAAEHKGQHAEHGKHDPRKADRDHTVLCGHTVTSGGATPRQQPSQQQERHRRNEQRHDRILAVDQRKYQRKQHHRALCAHDLPKYICNQSNIHDCSFIYASMSLRSES